MRSSYISHSTAHCIWVFWTSSRLECGFHKVTDAKDPMKDAADLRVPCRPVTPSVYYSPGVSTHDAKVLLDQESAAILCDIAKLLVAVPGCGIEGGAVGVLLRVFPAVCGLCRGCEH